jgi:hypothetical protein
MTFFTSTHNRIQSKEVVKSLILDGFALFIVFITPVIARWLQLPFYMIEPMRLMIIVSIAHTNRVNAHILAFVLPLFSWMVSGHPEFLKMMVIIGELSLNVFLFYFLLKKTGNVFLTMVAAIITSKIICYSFYLIFFSWMFVKDEAEPAFLLAQVITTMLFSLYVSVLFRKRSQ